MTACLLHNEMCIRDRGIAVAYTPKTSEVKKVGPEALQKLGLKKMGIKKDIYHCNEGHAALCNLQQMCIRDRTGIAVS